MKLLALETAVAPGSLALLVDGVVTARELPPERRTARSLAPALAELLAGAGLRAADLDRVAVTTGPGSFTGLRIGVTAAKTLAYAAGAECVAVNTLAVLAAQATPNCDDGSDGWAVLDAQRRELFAARFSSIGEAAIIAEDAWLARLKPGDLVTGPVLSRLRDRLPEGVLVADESTWSPRAETVAELAMQSDAYCTPFELTPRYYRLSAAEEKLQRKG